MTRPFRLRLFLLFAALVASGAACRDPNPTFVFDAGVDGGNRDGTATAGLGDAPADRGATTDGGGQ